MTTLFEITGEIEAIMAILESEDDEWTQEQLANFLEKQEEGLAAKIDGYVHVHRELGARAKAQREEASHLTKMARACENQQERLKEAIKFVSGRLGRNKFEGKSRKITVSSGGVAIEVVDEGLVPDDFKQEVLQIKVDKKGLRDCFVETGEILPGIEIRPIVRVMFR